MVTLLKRPYGALFNYDLAWTFAKLKDICTAENVEIPDRQSI